MRLLGFSQAVQIQKAPLHHLEPEACGGEGVRNNLSVQQKGISE